MWPLLVQEKIDWYVWRLRMKGVCSDVKNIEYDIRQIEKAFHPTERSFRTKNEEVYVEYRYYHHLQYDFSHRTYCRDGFYCTQYSTKDRFKTIYVFEESQSRITTTHRDYDYSIDWIKNLNVPISIIKQ